MRKLGRLNLLIVITVLIFAANVFGGSRIAHQSDGKTVVSYSTQIGTTNYIALRRFTYQGIPDMTFGSGGRSELVMGTVNRIAVQPDNKILVAGTRDSRGILVKYTADGSLDRSFGAGNGFVTDNFGSSGLTTYSDVLPYTDGKILAVGSSYEYLKFARYNADGTFDRTFGFLGVQIVGIGGTVAFDPHAHFFNEYGTIRVIAASYIGTKRTYSIVQLTSRGTLDTSFDGDGKLLGSQPISYFYTRGTLFLGGTIENNLLYNLN